MKSDNENHNQVSLNDLFALKRAERPDDEFWENFQRELHVRQRAEAIEPKRWWFMLPRVFTGLTKYQMPIGATAVLAITFLSLQDYSEPGFQAAYTEPVLETPAVVPATPLPQVELAVETTTPEVAAIEPVVETPALPAVSQKPRQPAQSFELSPMVVWAGPAFMTPEMVPAIPTPSQRSIAANLAKVEAERLQVGRMLGEPEVNLTAAVMRSETLDQIRVPEPTRERLFVYQAPADDFEMQANRPGRDTHGLIARRINQADLYDSVRRLSADADRLTLKF
jgi:hypothetical protein